jgi:hypothetical protein
VHHQTWVLEHKAKEDKVFHAKCAEYLTGQLSIALPAPSKLANFDKHRGVSIEADADETERPPGEPAQLNKSDKKTIWTWLLYTKVQRAEAQQIHKRQKEEVQHKPHPAHAPA